MIIGFCTVDDENSCVSTHKDSYLLDTLTVVSVRKPFLAGGILFGLGSLGFTAAFADLLYPGEIVVTLGCSVLALLMTWQVGQLKLLSRDLRGSELSGVIWGRYASLNQKRREIVLALGSRRRTERGS